jgi:flavin-dependent dehydrogenase
MVDALPPVRRADPAAVTQAREALIVGGGLAGGALAARLAAAGRDVVLLERESGPHDKVCGEFLSREAIEYLAGLGIDPLALGAQRIDTVRLASGTRIATVSLPFPALSLSRRALDDALLRRAAELGADIRMGARVQSLVPGAGGWQARTADGGEHVATTAFLATGKHDVRGWPRPEGPQPDLIGFKQYWRLSAGEAADLAGRVELILFPGGYAGLEPVEGGRANLCLVVRRTRFAALGQQWPSLLDAIRADSPLLRQRLSGAQPCMDRPLAISSIPYGYVRAKSDGLWRLGDQAAVIPSFSGDGMSIALHCANLAAACFLTGASAAEFQRRLAADVGLSVRFATMLSAMSVHPLGRNLIASGLSFLPGAMRVVAAATRIPRSALTRAGAGAVVRV